MADSEGGWLTGRFHQENMVSLIQTQRCNLPIENDGKSKSITTPP